MPTFLPMADNEDVLDDEEDPYGMDENTLSKVIYCPTGQCGRRVSSTSLASHCSMGLCEHRCFILCKEPHDTGDTTLEKACQLLMDQLCDAPLDHDEPNRIIVPRNTLTDASHTVFHAGQDLLLAGHTKLACRLYACYKATFLCSHWDLSEKNKQNIRALVQSGGEKNYFDNHLLAV
eukprot:scaffold83883_cov62-Attheya_sp.AAC.2